MKIEFKNVNEIIPYEKNPRKNDKAVDQVIKSIKEYGFKNPIIIDENNVIIAGHTRHKASKKMGMTFVPVIQVTDLTEEQKKGYRIADNRTSEFAEWDMDLLKFELKELEVFTGFEFGTEVMARKETEGINVYDTINKDNKKDETNEEIIIDQDGKSPKELYESYMNSQVRQIILIYDGSEYKKVIEYLKELQIIHNVNNNSDCLIKLLKEKGYEFD